MNGSKGTERRFHGYNSSQKMLLVGEGDFSFSAWLAGGLRTAENMVASSYLNSTSLIQYHWTSVPHLEELESLGCLLLYKVDVYKMHRHHILKNMKFDIIIFNFPHAGHYDYLCERDPELIEMHKDLVEAYYRSSSTMLTEGGEVHLRHREDPPYDSWNVVSLAAKAGLTLKEKVFFNKSNYHGYHNKRGGGINTNKTFPIICAFTFKFVLRQPEVVDHHHGLSNKNEVHVLEVNNQVRNDEIQVLCEKDAGYDHVGISELKDEDHGQQHLKSDEDDDRFKKEEGDDLLEKNDVNDNLFVLKNEFQKWCCLAWLFHKW